MFSQQMRKKKSLLKFKNKKNKKIKIHLTKNIGRNEQTCCVIYKENCSVNKCGVLNIFSLAQYYMRGVK